MIDRSHSRPETTRPSATSAPRFRAAPIEGAGLARPKGWKLLARGVRGISDRFPCRRPACTAQESPEEHAAYVGNLHQQEKSDAGDGRIEDGRPPHKGQNSEAERYKKRKHGEGRYADAGRCCDRYGRYDDSGKYRHPSLCTPSRILPITPRFEPSDTQLRGISRLYTLAFKIAIIKRTGVGRFQRAAAAQPPAVFFQTRAPKTDFIIAVPARRHEKRVMT